MAETEEQKTEEAVEQKPQAHETEAPEKNTEAASKTEESAETVNKSEAVPVIWSQKRVPNIEKGYNTSVPFYMMGILVALIILSVIFAKITS